MTRILSSFPGYSPDSSGRDRLPRIHRLICFIRKKPYLCRLKYRKMEVKNIFSDIDEFEGARQYSVIHDTPHCRIERIVSPDYSTPEGLYYEQEFDQFVYLVQGEAVIELDKVSRKLCKGDYLFIPRGCKHRIEKSSGEPASTWLCVFIKD